MSPRRFLTDSDRYPWRPLKVTAIAMAVLLTAVCGGGGWTPHAPRVPSPPPPDLSVMIPREPMALSPDGVKVASLTGAGGLQIYDWQARTQPVQLENPDCQMGMGAPTIRFSRDGGMVAKVCRDGGIVVWETSGGKHLFTAPCGYNDYASVLAWSHDGRRLAAVCQGRIRMWDTSTGQMISQFPATRDPWFITALAFTRSGSIYSSHKDGWVRLWGPAGEPLRAITFNSHVDGLLLRPDEKQLAVVQRNPDGNGLSSEVVLWDPDTGLKRRLKAVDADLPTLVAFSPDGALLVLSILRGRVSVFSTISNKYVATVDDTARVEDVVIRPDGTIVAIVGQQVRTWRCCGR